MLRPELFGEAFAEVVERVEPFVKLFRFVIQESKVVHLPQSPSFGDQKSFEISLDSFLQNLDAAVSRTRRCKEYISRAQAFAGQQEPILRVGLVRLHASFSPR